MVLPKSAHTKPCEKDQVAQNEIHKVASKVCVLMVVDIPEFLSAGNMIHVEVPQRSSIAMK